MVARSRENAVTKGIGRRHFDAFAAQRSDLAAAVAVLGQLKLTERVAHFLAEIDTLYR